MDFDQIYVRGSTSNLSISPPPGRIDLELDLARDLRYRRLYIGWVWTGRPASGRLILNASFRSKTAAGSRGDFEFQWGFPVASIVPLASIAPMRNTANGCYAVPPFTVEGVPDSLYHPSPCVVPCGRDELVVAVPPLSGAGRTPVLRMMPIPVMCVADLLVVSVDSVFASDADSDAVYGLDVVVGLRSSIAFPG